MRDTIVIIKWGVFLFLLVSLITTVNLYLPAQHIPWKRLDTSRPLGIATKSQLFRLSLSSSEKCMAVADNVVGFNSVKAAPKNSQSRKTGQTVCGWDIARTVYGQNQTRLTPDETAMQCPLSIAAYLWTREVDKIARERYGEGLAKIHHMGSYSCRRQVGNNSNQWSEHAYANAWDVSGFELTDGHFVSVLTNWDTVDRDAAFLRDIRDAACKLFRVTLTPDYNSAHSDHFHLDMGPTTACT